MVNLVRLLVFVFCFCFVLLAHGQFEAYKDYYQFPINPSNQNYLAGTVGEIRTSHFHTGIDVKTGGRTGWPVYATADGYISRIKVATGGYGQALYMAHKNGTFSVYAHLDSFEPNIERFVRTKQYVDESYTVEIFPKENQFYFEKGDLIGYAGNTGSSSGPHLHFEIRDRNHRPLDLLQFGFSEVRDRMPPVVRKIAFTSLDGNARVNQLFGRYEFDLIRTGNVYRTNVPIELKGKVGVEIYCYDPMDGIPNKNGVIKTVMTVDEDTLFYENKQSLTFSLQRNILEHYNYEAYKNGSKRFNKLYLDDGNEHNIYLKNNRGIYFDRQQKIKIFTEDSYQNLSVTEILINNDKIVYPPAPNFRQYEIIGNYIHFKSKKGVGIRLNEEWQPISPYYSDGIEDYCLWNMADGIPKGIFLDGKTIETELVVPVPSNQQFTYHQQEFETAFGRRALFDTLYLSFKKEIDSVKHKELFRFQNAQDPIRSNIEITLKPEHDYDKEKSAVYSVFGKRNNFIGGSWDERGITFKTRDLVTYTILTDSIPPTVKAVSVSNTNMKLKISDALSGIKSYRAELNGEFQLMRYEPKNKTVWWIPKEPNIQLKGEFTFEAVDNANNKTIYSITL